VGKTRRIRKERRQGGKPYRILFGQANCKKFIIHPANSNTIAKTETGTKTDVTQNTQIPFHLTLYCAKLATSTITRESHPLVALANRR
jgi:hypothetical protein